MGIINILGKGLNGITNIMGRDLNGYYKCSRQWNFHELNAVTGFSVHNPKYHSNFIIFNDWVSFA